MVLYSINIVQYIFSGRAFIGLDWVCLDREKHYPISEGGVNYDKQLKKLCYDRTVMVGFN